MEKSLKKGHPTNTSRKQRNGSLFCEERETVPQGSFLRGDGREEAEWGIAHKDVSFHAVTSEVAISYEKSFRSSLFAAESPFSGG